MESLRKADLLRATDELVVLDTSATKDSTEDVVGSYCGVYRHMPELLLPAMPRVREWIPEWEDTALSAPQVKDGILSSFAGARDLAAGLAKHDIQFWIDTDDVIEEENPGELRKTFEDEWKKGRLSLLFLDYEYAHDKDGKPSALLKRERFYDRRVWHWKGVCHEVLVPHEGAKIKDAGYFQDVKSRVVHRKDHARDGKVSDIRNYLILREAVEQEERETGYADTRYYFYLANAARGLKRFKEAIDFYKLTLGRSGSKEDCFLSANNIATLYMTEGFMYPASAYQWAFEMMKIDPEDPRGYYQAQHAAYLLGKHAESLWWFQVGGQKPPPRDSLHLYEPYDVEVKPYMVAAASAKETEQESIARDCVQYLSRLGTTREDVFMVIDEVTNWMAARRIGSSLHALAVNSGARSPEQMQRAVSKAAEQLATVPFVIEEEGVGKTEPEDKRRGDDLVFFCGRAWEPFGPHSAARGLGGSERAVWEVSRRMAKRGFRVTVYCSVPSDERGVDQNGVLWRHWAEFDKRRPRGTIVYWRSPANLELPYPAMKRVLWCHDVQNPADWTPARIALCDHCLVLSKFHAGTLGGKLPSDKLVLTRNGIDAKLFAKSLKENPKNPKRIIFSSSPDRGALTAIRAFQIARAHDSNLELHIFYGFSKVYQGRAAAHWAFGVPDLGYEQSALTYQYRVEQAALETEGVYWHGRANWKQMAAEFAKAGIWLYPTRFPEISCIGAMEAQAAGCCVVASNEAALAETVDWESGIALRVTAGDLTDTADAILTAMDVAADDPRRKELSGRSLERFEWDSVCDEWADLLRVPSDEPIELSA